MNAKLLFLIICLLAAGAAVVLVQPAAHVTDGDNQDNEVPPPPSDMPYTWFQGEDESTWPTMSWLHTEDNRIVDESGNTVILRGVGIEDPWRFYNYENELRPEVFQTIAENWNANVVKVPIFPNHWETKPELFSDYYDHVIRACHKYGMYVILEWRGVGNPISGETTADGARWGSQTNMEKTETFWHQIAERYKDNSWVIYDIFSKPTLISWDNWKLAAENIIDVIRSHNPKALTLVSGITSAFDLRSVATDPIDRDNIIYAAHIYPVVEAGTVRNQNEEIMWEMLNNYIGLVAENYSVMVSEWGYHYRPGELGGGNEWAYPHTFGEPLIEWLNAKKLSWVGWIWSANWVPAMIEGWYELGYPPSNFGQLVKDTLTTFGDNGIENIVLDFLRTTDVGHFFHNADTIEIAENYYNMGNLVLVIDYTTSSMGHPQFMLMMVQDHTAEITLNASGEVVSAFCSGGGHGQGKIWDLINQTWVDA